jgi:hypothetical protein
VQYEPILLPCVSRPPCRRVVLASYFGLTKDRVALEVVAHLFKALFSPTMNLPPIQNTEDLFE